MKKYMYSFLGFVLGLTFVLTIRTQIPEPVIASVPTYSGVTDIQKDYFEIDDVEKFVGYKVTSEEMQKLINNKVVLYGRSNPMRHTLINLQDDGLNIDGGTLGNSSSSTKPNNDNGNFVLLHNNQYNEIKNGVIKGYNKSSTKVEDVNVSNFIDKYIGNISYPLEDNFMKITSNFGVREPIKELGGTDYEFHTGTDYSNTNILGEPIKSISSGRIKKIQQSDSGYGNLIIVESGEIDVYYAHLRSIDKRLEEGMDINIGQVIGEVGSTGRSTGPHLHLEINIGDIAINPELFFKITKASNNKDISNSLEDENTSQENNLIDKDYLEENKIKPL